MGDSLDVVREQGNASYPALKDRFTVILSLRDVMASKPRQGRPKVARYFSAGQRAAGGTCAGITKTCACRTRIVATAFKMVVLVMVLSAPVLAWDGQEFPTTGRRHVSHLDCPAVGIDLLAVLFAYPKSCAEIRISGDKRVILVMRDGTRIVYDDGKKKSFERKLKDPDLEDTLAQVYDPGPVRRGVPVNFDPGRFRVDAFLKAVYGADKAKVRAGLTSVDFLGTRVWFTKRNGAAQALERVAMKLARLVRETPALADYILPVGGTFNYRYVRGTKRLSPHSYGIAIDLNPKRGAYWRWGKRPPNLLDLRKRYPARIVSVFEKHGFIWGGKWHHYDLMHFEYRPELILKSRLLKAFSGRRSANPHQ